MYRSRFHPLKKRSQSLSDAFRMEHGSAKRFFAARLAGYQHKIGLTTSFIWLRPVTAKYNKIVALRPRFVSPSHTLSHTQFDYVFLFASLVRCHFLFAILGPFSSRRRCCPSKQSAYKAANEHIYTTIAIDLSRKMTFLY